MHRITPDAPAVLAYAIRMRARWLDSLSEDARAAIAGMSHRRVERLFAEWLASTGELN